MNIKSKSYGRVPKVGAAMLYECSNERGLQMQCTNYESSLLSIKVPDFYNSPRAISGQWDMPWANVTRSQPPPGAIIGRIGYSAPSNMPLTIRKREYSIPTKSEYKTFRRKIWKGTIFGTPEVCGMRTKLISPDGDQGLPGEIELTVCYTITRQNELYIEHLARSRKKSALSLDTHLRWNLSNGYGVLEHEAVIYAARFSTQPTLNSLKTLNRHKVNFQRRRTLLATLNHYFLLGSDTAEQHHPLVNTPRKMTAALWLYDPKSRRYLELFTNYPLLYVGVIRGKLGSSLAIKPCIPYDAPALISGRRDRYSYTSLYRFGILK